MAGHYTGSYLDRSNGWRAVATLALQHLRSPEQVCAGQTADGARESLFGANDHYPNVRASSHIAGRLVWAGTDAQGIDLVGAGTPRANHDLVGFARRLLGSSSLGCHDADRTSGITLITFLTLLAHGSGRSRLALSARPDGSLRASLSLRAFGTGVYP